MRVQELFDILKNTELKQIIVGEDDQQVLGFMNLALIEVYAKFAILQEEQIIRVEEGKTRYRLQDNSQKVLQVFMRDLKKNPLKGFDAYKEVGINDINDDESIYTPQPYVMHIPNPNEGREYSVLQIVTPPYITKKNIGKVDFIIPPQYLSSVLNYAAYRAYKSMNGDEQSEIGSHYKAYMISCKEVLKNGLHNYSVLTNVKLTDRGFQSA